MDTGLHSQLVKPLKKRREFFGITQLEMAKKIGHSSAAYIAMIERGKRNLNVCDYVLWREALGMSLDFMQDVDYLDTDWKKEEDPFKRVERFTKRNGNAELS